MSQIIIAAFLVLFGSPALATIHFSLTGSAGNSNLGLQTSNKTAVSGSVAVDLGSHLRVGVTHRRESSHQEGYSEDADTKEYTYSTTTQLSTSNSVDITLILYNGSVFTPYLVAGVVKRHFQLATSTSDGVENFELPPSPTGGMGLGIRFHRNFSLKLSYTVSPGVRQESPSEEAQPVVDSYSSMGITYNL